jgi:hypothetical protein
MIVHDLYGGASARRAGKARENSMIDRRSMMAGGVALTALDLLSGHPDERAGCGYAGP